MITSSCVITISSKVVRTQFIESFYFYKKTSAKLASQSNLVEVRSWQAQVRHQEGGQSRPEHQEGLSWCHFLSPQLRHCCVKMTLLLLLLFGGGGGADSKGFVKMQMKKKNIKSFECKHNKKTNYLNAYSIIQIPRGDIPCMNRVIEYSCTQKVAPFLLPHKLVFLGLFGKINQPRAKCKSNLNKHIITIAWEWVWSRQGNPYLRTEKPEHGSTWLLQT